MQTNLEYIQKNPEEFKWCKECCVFNRFQNSRCHNCGGKDFETEIERVKVHINEEIEFQIYNNGEDLETLKNIYYEV